MNLRTILFSQYPALFLLAVLFLIAHLRVRIFCPFKDGG